MENGYKFTQDWFSFNIPAWENAFSQIRGKRDCFLEIGSYEGRSTVWLMENVIPRGGEIFCIDTWEGGWEHSSDTMKDSFERFKYNTDLASEKSNVDVYAIRRKSYEALSDMIYNQREYDFIYVDGSHAASDVLSDACMAYHLCRKGGVIAFDDYLWGPAEHPLMRPKPAVDAFINLYADKVSVFSLGHQVWVTKN